jgi:hypothetical protein
VAALRLRWRVIRWSLLAVFLAGLGLVLNDWLPPQPRCVIPFSGHVSVDYISDDGGMILATNFIKGVQESRVWDTNSGANLGDLDLVPLHTQEPEPRIISYVLGYHGSVAKGDFETTRDWRFVSVREPAGPSYFQKLLGAWWPWNSNPDDKRVTVFESVFDSRRIVGQLHGRYGNGYLSNDGRTMITPCLESNGSLSLRCWDLPLRPPLRLVAGIPLGIGLLIVLAGWWRGRRRARMLAA